MVAVMVIMMVMICLMSDFLYDLITMVKLTFSKYFVCFIREVGFPKIQVPQKCSYYFSPIKPKFLSTFWENG